VMLKITIPTRPGLYGDLACDPRVLRVVALSAATARRGLRPARPRSHLIASFSRALLEGLTENQTDEQFNAQLESSIEQIYQASVNKQRPALSPRVALGHYHDGYRCAADQADGGRADHTVHRMRRAPDHDRHRVTGWASLMAAAAASAPPGSGPGAARIPALLLARSCLSAARAGPARFRRS